MLTKDEIFAKVRERAKDQRKARDENRTKGLQCMYRAPNGLACFVGCLIPDELYKPEMDHDIGGGSSIGQIFKHSPAIAEYLGRDNLWLLIQLQGIHDGTPTKQWDDEINWLEDAINKGEF